MCENIASVPGIETSATHCEFFSQYSSTELNVVYFESRQVTGNIFQVLDIARMPSKEKILALQFAAQCHVVLTLQQLSCFS